MKYNVLNSKFDLLAYSLDLAQQIFKKHGYIIGTITFTKPPKGNIGKASRVVRIRFTDCNTVNLVAAYSSGDEITLRKEVE